MSMMQIAHVDHRHCGRLFGPDSRHVVDKDQAGPLMSNPCEGFVRHSRMTTVLRPFILTLGFSLVTVACTGARGPAVADPSAASTSSPAGFTSGQVDTKALEAAKFVRCPLR